VRGRIGDGCPFGWNGNWRLVKGIHCCFEQTCVLLCRVWLLGFVVWKRAWRLYLRLVFPQYRDGLLDPELVVELGMEIFAGEIET
jgi:hypothetical protein